MKAFLPLCLAVAACSSQAVPEAFNAQAKADEEAAREHAADSKAVKAGFEPDQPEPMKTVSVDPQPAPAPGAILPRSDQQYRYIGRWAATRVLCDTGAWQFKIHKLSTAGETHCDLPTVAVVPTGYELTGTCQAEGKKIDQIVRLGFDERRRTMHVESKSLGPIDLLYCGD